MSAILTNRFYMNTANARPVKRNSLGMYSQLPLLETPSGPRVSFLYSESQK